jgi:hypothetical protein
MSFLSIVNLKPTKNVSSTSVVLAAMLLLFSYKSHATHMVGADLYYECLGNNQYRVTLKFYRDCAGINAPNSAYLSISSASCGISSTQYLPRVSF